MAKRSIDKVSVAQMTSNNDGKTSGSGSMGVYICFIGGISFLMGVVDCAFISHKTDIMIQTIIFTGIGAALLGVRKAVGRNDAPAVVDDPTVIPPTTDVIADPTNK